MYSNGKTQDIQIPNGKLYRVQRLTLGALRGWFDWVRATVGDPFETAERFIGRVPDDVLKEEFRAACEVRDDLRFPSLATKTSARALASEQGVTQLFRQLLDPQQYTDEDVWLLVQHLSAQGIGADGESAIIRVIKAAQGISSGGQAKNGEVPPAFAGET